MKVIGVGFGRTGTASLKEALEHLGFGPCHHMFDVVREPHRIRQWIDAAEGRPVNWDVVFAGYQATVDWPAVAFWRELIACYPDARFPRRTAGGVPADHRDGPVDVRQRRRLPGAVPAARPPR